MIDQSDPQRAGGMSRRVLLASSGAAAGVAGMAGSQASAQPGPGVTSRPFRMALTPQPRDYTPAAFLEAYDLIRTHADLYAHHLDEGVPWRESLDGTPFAPAVMTDLTRRRDNTPQDANVFLAVTPLAISRDAMAGNWASDSHMPVPAPFAGRPLDDEIVVRAFINYCRRMAQLFRPTYMAYAIEISPIAGKPAAAAQFVNLARQVYTTLKAEFPRLALFPTYVLGSAAELNAAHRKLVQDLLPFTDILAVSTYPYTTDGIGGDASRIPADWFSKFAALAPSKPFAVAETGFLAGNFVHLLGGAVIFSSPRQQATYMQRLLDEANRMRMAFVVWFVPADYDRLWARMSAAGASPWLQIWMRAGLRDAELRPRPGTAIWDAWLRLPFQPGR